MNDKRRHLPSVDRLLNQPDIKALTAASSRPVVVAAIREVLAEVRDRGGPIPDRWVEAVAARIRERSAPSLAPVLNATGVVLHTNLGRAPLATEALEAVRTVASGYSTLEFDLAEGTRGTRHDHCRRQLAELTGAETGLVVNNAAGALLLALNELAAGQDVLISRGELIEIGGSFRIPDIMAKSGVRLHEVGTTNRTHLDDYQRALDGGATTGAILTVHQSNFAQTGFVTSPRPSDLAALAHEAGLPYCYDVGSGLLADLSPWGLTTEPRVQDAVEAGADLVIFSGDKLLGGPQAGCLVGPRALLDRCQRNPLARALRADKATLAALEATLSLYRDPERARRRIPVLEMLTRDAGELERHARALLALCPPALQATVEPGESAVGGGAFPGARLPTTLLVVDPGGVEGGARGLARRLREGQPAVIPRIADDRVVFDPRTLAPDSLVEVAQALTRAIGA